MKILFFCAWWGLDHLGTEGMLSKIKAAGFDGVEIGIPTDSAERDKLRDLLQKYELGCIAHQYQAEGNFEAYKTSFRKSLESTASFNPLHVNSHTGKDFWTVEQNLQLVDIGLEVEAKYNLPILHETHRGRFPFSTFAARQYFDAQPALKINADFSHWVCVSESLLEDQQEIMAEAISRTEHIHARVGYAEGPQIPDPRAPEWQTELDTFVGWWQRIIDARRAEGRDYFTITPEFGPTPYTWALPYSQEPVSDFFEINCWMKKFLEEKLMS